MSPHGLPPLKFHSSLPKPHSVLNPRLDQNVDYDDNEIVASVSDNMDTNSDDCEDYDDDDVRRFTNGDSGSRNSSRMFSTLCGGGSSTRSLLRERVQLTNAQSLGKTMFKGIM
ncbi:hypothetical protein Ddye_015143 [Dipteronia dyeriana]|uniref:Uncharacterized protein n=1 Tax=Dipteronia dyeriana TaxID=168575 RepID=A0AAD9WXL8_9ROSI|nr:hypothetical protein Ddye_015143 [Dipteronia dyeriana]